MKLAEKIFFSVALSCSAGALAWSQEVGNGTKQSSEDSAPPEKPPVAPQTGLASYYHHEFQGRLTASGELLNQNALTAAHRTLPFGTLVRVINLRNQRSVVLRVTDRGPMLKDRVIDVTQRAARELGFLAIGMTWVKVEVVAVSDLSDLVGK